MKFHDEEARLSDNNSLPEYLPGDLLMLEFVVEHEMNLDELGVWFSPTSGEEEEGADQELFLLSDLTLVERTGEKMHSRAILSQRITRQYPPGDYFLRAINGFLMSETRYRLKDVPDMKFRILPEPKTSPKVLNWEFLG